MNNNVSRNLTSLKWEAKNTYLVMPARRHFYPPVVWRTGGIARRFYGGPDPVYVYSRPRSLSDFINLSSL